jgi:DNA adenine methylase
VRSWIEHKGLNNSNVAESFFEQNIQTIKAQPFVKWVGGKRQLIEQFQSLLPSEFNDYFEPFL